MRRSLSARAGVALLAVSFLSVVNGPAALYQCPAHSPRAASSQAATMHPGAHAHHAALPDGKAPHCTCGGMCCCSTPTAGFPAAAAGAQWLPTLRLAQVLETHHVARSVDWPLPFATGPPHAA